MYTKRLQELLSVLLLVLEDILRNRSLFLPILVSIGILVRLNMSSTYNMLMIYTVNICLYFLYLYCLHIYNDNAVQHNLLVLSKYFNRKCSDHKRIIDDGYVESIDQQKKAEFIYLLFIVIAFFFFAIGLGYTAMSFRINNLSTVNKLTENIGPVYIVGKVRQFDIRSNGVRLYLTNVYEDSSQTLKSLDVGIVRINWRKQVGMEDNIIGRWVKIKAVVMPPPRRVFPDSFDFAQYAFFKGIGGIGYAIQRPVFISEQEVVQKLGYRDSAKCFDITQNCSNDEPSYNGNDITKKLAEYIDIFGQYINKLRKDVTKSIKTVIPEPSAGIASAILVGESTQIDEKDYYALRVAGLAHIIAISGMHVVVVVAMVFFLMKLLLLHIVPLCTRVQIALYYPITKLAALCSIAVSGFYVVLAGAPISAQRALVSSTVVMLCVLYDKTIHPTRCLCLAAIVILLITPEALLSPGLQMSFAACFALVKAFELYDGYIFKWLRRRLRKNSNDVAGKSVLYKSYRLFILVQLNALICIEYLAKLMIASVAASAATTPFIIYHFNQFAPYGVIANLICVPLTDFFIMPLGLLSMLLMPIGLEKLTLMLLGHGITFMLYIAHKISMYKYADIHVSEIQNIGIIIISVGMFMLCVTSSNILRIISIVMITIGFSARKDYNDIILVVSGDAKIFAVRYDTITGNSNDQQHNILQKKYIFSSRQQERFTQNVWEQKIGKTRFLPHGINHWARKSKCGIQGCKNDICMLRTSKGENSIVIGSNIDNLNMLCQQYKPDIFINMHNNMKCSFSIYNITLSDLRKNGTHVINDTTQKTISIKTSYH